MKYSTKVGIVVCLATMVAFSLSAVFAGNETGNTTKNMTNITKNMTNVTNATNPFAQVKGEVKKGPIIVDKGVNLNNTSSPTNETHLLNPQPNPPKIINGIVSTQDGLTAPPKIINK
jgi:hypothetical protein